MKKILTLLTLSLFSVIAQAEDIKIYFLPLKVDAKIKLKATFAQDAKGGYVCKGTSKELPKFLNEPVEFSCDGEKESFESFVERELQGKYIGSNFIYDKTSLQFNRGWYIPAQQLKGLMIYYYK